MDGVDGVSECRLHTSSCALSALYFVRYKMICTNLAQCFTNQDTTDLFSPISLLCLFRDDSAEDIFWHLFTTVKKWVRVWESNPSKQNKISYRCSHHTVYQKDESHHLRHHYHVCCNFCFRTNSCCIQLCCNQSFLPFCCHHDGESQG